MSLTVPLVGSWPAGSGAQAPRGELAEYQSPTGYRASWGRLKAKTYPTPGNHEYLDPAGGAAGYFGYFGPAAGDQQVPAAPADQHRDHHAIHDALLESGGELIHRDRLVLQIPHRQLFVLLGDRFDELAPMILGGLRVPRSPGLMDPEVSMTTAMSSARATRQ